MKNLKSKLWAALGTCFLSTLYSAATTAAAYDPTLVTEVDAVRATRLLAPKSATGLFAITAPTGASLTIPDDSWNGASFVSTNVTPGPIFSTDGSTLLSALVSNGTNLYWLRTHASPADFSGGNQYMLHLGVDALGTATTHTYQTGATAATGVGLRLTFTNNTGAYGSLSFSQIITALSKLTKDTVLSASDETKLTTINTVWDVTASWLSAGYTFTSLIPTYNSSTAARANATLRPASIKWNPLKGRRAGTTAVVTFNPAASTFVDLRDLITGSAFSQTFSDATAGNVQLSIATAGTARFTDYTENPITLLNTLLTLPRTQRTLQANGTVTISRTPSITESLNAILLGAGPEAMSVKRGLIWQRIAAATAAFTGATQYSDFAQGSTFIFGMPPSGGVLFRVASTAFSDPNLTVNGTWYDRLGVPLTGSGSTDSLICPVVVPAAANNYTPLSATRGLVSTLEVTGAAAATGYPASGDAGTNSFGLVFSSATSGNMLVIALRNGPGFTIASTDTSTTAAAGGALNTALTAAGYPLANNADHRPVSLKALMSGSD